MDDVNLIDAFNYYLIIAFVVGTILRTRNYLAMTRLIYQSKHRWPKLRALAKADWAIFLRWSTVFPMAATLVLTIGNTWASHFVWTDARVTFQDLWSHSLAFIAVGVTAALMGFLDFKAVFLFAQVDRPTIEAILDRAEHWLVSWKAPAVRVLSLGFIHPRRIVGEQVHQALVDASVGIGGQLWYLSLQIVLRIALGLALWITWVVNQ